MSETAESDDETHMKIQEKDGSTRPEDGRSRHIANSRKESERGTFEVRKGQERLLKRASEQGMPNEFLTILSDETKTLKELERIASFLYMCGNDVELADAIGIETGILLNPTDFPYERGEDDRYVPNVRRAREFLEVVDENSPSERVAKLSFLTETDLSYRIMRREKVSPTEIVSARRELAKLGIENATGSETALFLACGKTTEALDYVEAEERDRKRFEKETNEYDEKFLEILRDGNQNPYDVLPYPKDRKRFASKDGFVACEARISASEFERILDGGDEALLKMHEEIAKASSPAIRNICMEISESKDLSVIVNDETRSTLERFIEIMPDEMTGTVDVRCRSVLAREGSKSWEFTFRTQPKTAYDRSGGIRGSGNAYDVRLVVFPKGFVYETLNTRKTSRLIPARLETFDKLFGIEEFADVARRLLDAVRADFGEDGALQTAMLEFGVKSPLRLPPISVADLLGKRSLNEAMRPKYKKTPILNWNRVGLRLGYATYLSSRYMDDSSLRRTLQSANDGNLKRIVEEETATGEYDHVWEKDDSIVAKMLLMHVMRPSLKDGDEVYDADMMVSDLLRMARMAKRRFSFRRKSVNGIDEIHDELAIVTRNSNLVKIRKRKNSQFDALRKALPKKEFEWIRTTGRLRREGLEMKHCVASYASRVDEDKCAIYSFELDDGYAGNGSPTRYTAEFVVERGKDGKRKYAVRQIQTIADRGSSKTAWDVLGEYAERAGTPNEVKESKKKDDAFR